MDTGSQTKSVTRHRPKTRMTAVKSRAVDAIGYDGERRILDIRFRSGSVYRYFDVSPQRHAALMRTESIGAYVNAKIKRHYRCQPMN